MNDVRILKGYSKDQQKELEYTKGNMSINDFLHSITYFPANTECDSIKDKYDEADTDERISIIRDILDFYTDKAKFPEQKYYVHLIKGNEKSYLNITSYGSVDLLSNLEYSGQKNKFTREEIIAIDPRLVPFMEEVEAD